MEKYNSKIAKLEKLELVLVSADRDPAKAVAWAKKESFPWPTILMTDIKKTLIKDIKTKFVPTYVLVDKDGKEILRGNSDSLIKKYEELTK